MNDRIKLWCCVAGFISAFVVGIVVGWVARPVPESEAPKPTGTKAAVPTPSGFKPVALPDPTIPGFVFPEKEETIVGWTKANNQRAINKHGWGIWAALTSPSGETFEGQELLVFETWLTPQNLLDSKLLKATPGTLPRDPLPLRRLRQFGPAKARSMSSGDEDTVKGFVKYDPTAAQHINDNKLLSKAVLESLLQMQKAEVPSFPNTAVTLKPVFKVLDQSKLVSGRYYMLSAWPGPPAKPSSFPPTAWNQCVWVDVQDDGLGKGTGDVDKLCKPDGSSRTDATTYGLAWFIHFRLSAAQASTLNAIRETANGNQVPRAVPGNSAILVAMHVTSREITRWTWQTFWWSPNPDKPPLPSSEAIAANRPAQLKNAPRNYSMAIGYDMVDPPQPNTGGMNVGNSVYVYNPWLEAGFGPADLPASQPGSYNQMKVENNVGVQTNCMSCHAPASFPFKTTPDDTPILYTGDQYIDLNGPQFKGVLKTDFLWSIPDNAR